MQQANIDYEVVRRYWEDAAAQSATAASYMAHEQGLPDDCVLYRLEKEAEVVDAWLAPLDAAGSVLDVGAGAGAWAARFAGRFARVVAIEQSKAMCDAAALNLQRLDNVQILNTDAMSYETEERFAGIFLGGLLMYLNREDAVALLRRLDALLDDGGRIIVRESTVRRGTEVRTGQYQVVYRSPAEYASLIRDAGLRLVETRLNRGYEAMEIGERLVDYLRLLPYLRSREVSIIGGRVWAFVRATQPVSLRLLPRVLARLRVPWPHLQNHFFLLERRCPGALARPRSNSSQAR